MDPRADIRSASHVDDVLLEIFRLVHGHSIVRIVPEEVHIYILLVSSELPYTRGSITDDDHFDRNSSTNTARGWATKRPVIDIQNRAPSVGHDVRCNPPCSIRVSQNCPIFHLSKSGWTDTRSYRDHSTTRGYDLLSPPSTGISMDVQSHNKWARWE